MKPGDIVTDSRAAAWTLVSPLGQGIWGHSWLVEAANGQRRVLKLPYEPSDLPPAAADRVPLMRSCAREQAELLLQDAQRPDSIMVRLEDRITLPSGGIALLFPHYPTTLERQLRSGVPLTEALQTVLEVSRALEKAKRTHGNLRPSNILLDPTGRPLLSDVVTTSAETLMVGADRDHPDRRRWAPTDRIASDTWALCQVLYCAASLDDASLDAGALPAPPAELDKVALADIRDRIERCLKREGANSRFVTRTAERLSAVLGRGLSKRADPSPPYRFLKAADLSPRLDEVSSLIDPAIEDVGKFILDAHARNSVFTGDDPIKFSVSVSPGQGVQDAEDVVCGLRVIDRDSGERVPLEDAQFSVDRHASGRLRYSFSIPNLTPGRYDANVAFSIKDSGHTPVTAEGAFEVRPAAGYVPPPKESAPTPLSFPGGKQADDSTDPTATSSAFWDEDDEDAATVLMSHKADIVAMIADEQDDELGELIDAFPRPLAPTGPGTQIDETPVPAPVAAAPTPTLTPPPAPQATPIPRAPQPTPLAAVPTPPPSQPGFVASEPDSVVPPTGADPMPIGDQGPGWETTQAGEEDFFANPAPLPSHDALPGMQGDEDLLQDKASALDQLRAKLDDLTNGDPRVFYGAAVGGSLLLVLLLAGVLRACN